MSDQNLSFAFVTGELPIASKLTPVALHLKPKYGIAQPLKPVAASMSVLIHVLILAFIKANYIYGISAFQWAFCVVYRMTFMNAVKKSKIEAKMCQIVGQFFQIWKKCQKGVFFKKKNLISKKLQKVFTFGPEQAAIIGLTIEIVSIHFTPCSHLH